MYMYNIKLMLQYEKEKTDRVNAAMRDAWIRGVRQLYQPSAEQAITERLKRAAEQLFS